MSLSASGILFNDGVCKLAGVDLSAKAKSIKVKYGAKALDDTTMGKVTGINKGGLLQWSATIVLEQDYSAASVHATLFPAVGTQIAVDVRATSGARSATNPSFTGTALLVDYEPIAGQVGEIMLCTVTLQSAGDLTAPTA